MKYSDFIKNNSIFLTLFAVVFTAIGITLLSVDKAGLHLWLNSCHTAFGDIFFRFYTLIADYGIYIVALCMLFWKAGAAIYLMIAEAAGGIVVQIVKHIVHAPRPRLFFDLENNPDALPVVEGVRMYSDNSFPSGHTNTFFILFFVICVVVWFYNKKETYLSMSLQVVCFLLALLGGYSRIYLSQHFAADIFAGGIIGTLTVIVLYPAFLWLNNKFPKVCAWHISLPIRRKGREVQQ